MTPRQLDTLRSRVVAGTGHRPDKLGGYTPAAVRKLRVFAEHVVDRARPKQIISGMALGWDQALANAAIANGVPFIAAVPFKGQESMWPFFSRKEYDLILSFAAEIVYVSDPGYAVWKMQKRNEWMVNKAEAVLALWDGSTGGTANCIAYVQRANRPLVNAWTDFEDF